MMRHARLLLTFAVVTAVCARGGAAYSAAFDFGAPFELLDSNDIDLSLGHFLYAINGSAGGDTQTVDVGGTAVLFEALPDSSNVTVIGTTNLANGAIGDFYAPTTDQTPLDEVLASHAYNDGGSFTLRLDNLSVGQNYQIQVIGIGDTRDCCTGREHTVASADGGAAADIPRAIDIDGDAEPHALTTIGTFTADDTFQDLLFSGPNNQSGLSGLILTSDMPLQIPQPRVLIDRNTGQVILENQNASAAGSLGGYSLLSNGGAFDQSGWTTISGNSDAAGDGSVDDNDEWTKLTLSGVTSDLSEFNFSTTPGDAAELGPGQQINLGAAWARTPIQDVTAEITLEDGSVVAIPVEYTGAAALAGDLDSDGDLDADDWNMFKNGSAGPALSSLLRVDAYRRGDLDGDGDRDLNDFGAFEAAFDSANGAGALNSLIATAAVPEPASILLIAFAVSMLGLITRRKSAVRAGVLAAFGLSVVIGGGDKANAVEINFGDSFEFLDSNDIDLSPGYLAYAINASGSGDNQTVDVGGTSVLFEAYPDSPNMSTITGGINLANGAIGDFYAPLTDQVALDEVLASHGYNDGEGFTLRLENLNIGQTYQVQVIGVGDTRGCCQGREHTVESVDGGTVGIIPRSGDLDGDTVFHALSTIGTFTAGAAFQDLLFTSPNTQAGFGALILTTDTPSSLQLIVDTATNEVTLTNNTVAPVTLDGYRITSAAGSLSPSGWNSIADRGTPLDGFPQGSGSGDGWESDSNISANELVEWYLNDEGAPSVLGVGESISLGAAFAGGEQDLQLTYHRLQNSGPVDGDYNNNGVVDAADYTVWRDNLGTSNTLPNDTTPGTVSTEDFAVWKTNFGTASGAVGATLAGIVEYSTTATPAGAAVPEPSALLLALCSIAAGLTFFRRRNNS